MLTRVTQNAITRQIQESLGRLQAEITRAQAVASSQKKLQAPSDDPVGTALLNRLRGETTRLDTYLQGVGFGQAVLGAEDGALDQAHAILTRAQEIATQHASDLVSVADRQAAAGEVAELERALLSLGNTAVGGRYVFAGLAHGGPPFAALDDPGFDPLAPYAGSPDPFSIRTADDQLVRLTTAGDQVFGASIAALDDLRQTLAAGTETSGNLAGLQSAADGLSLERASVGGRLARLGARDTEIRDAIVGAQTRQSSVEDADVAQVLTQLTQLQTALQVTLTAGRALLDLNVLDLVAL
jgi:flagellar hook-associated protein 3 FlgL